MYKQLNICIMETVQKREFAIREFSSLPLIGFGRKKGDDGKISSYLVKGAAGSVWTPEDPYVWAILPSNAQGLLTLMKVDENSVWEKDPNVDDSKVEWLKVLPGGISLPHGVGADIPFFADRTPAVSTTAKHKKGLLAGKPVEQVSLRVFLPIPETEIGFQKEDMRQTLEQRVDMRLASGEWKKKVSIAEILGVTSVEQPAEGSDSSTAGVQA